jgi:uncharacterized membrane protein HdeD (DUF308 family)
MMGAGGSKETNTTNSWRVTHMMLSRRGHSISLLSLGVITFLHALLVFTVVRGHHDVLVLIALLLFSLSLNTMILTVVARVWVGSRVTCWIGLLRLILCLMLLGPIAGDPERAFFALTVLIVLTGILEAYVWVQSRLEQAQGSFIGVAALVNVLLGSFALVNFHLQSASHIVLLFGMSLVISSAGPISAGIGIRRNEELADSVLKQTAEVPTQSSPTDRESLTSLSSHLDGNPALEDALHWSGTRWDQYAGKAAGSTPGAKPGLD